MQSSATGASIGCMVRGKSSPPASAAVMLPASSSLPVLGVVPASCALPPPLPAAEPVVPPTGGSVVAPAPPASGGCVALPPIPPPAIGALPAIAPCSSSLPSLLLQPDPIGRNAPAANTVAIAAPAILFALVDISRLPSLVLFAHVRAHSWRS